MTEHKPLPTGACLALIFVALLADAAKIVLDFLLIGVVIDSILITPITAFIFWLILSMNGKSMFEGKRTRASIMNLLVSIVPIINAIPDWTAYATYLTLEGRYI